ncbi:hypothetical protein G4B88_027401 [Cannabis sativa]|uniref:Uncharacterized protein n=1 Tax=Cannabis sativa TaxID=3483 RepID=A0A7J6HS01_CANSA|nr:hypothetical protein G4B88_027401 [Cannabis sativa]
MKPFINNTRLRSNSSEQKTNIHKKQSSKPKSKRSSDLPLIPSIHLSQWNKGNWNLRHLLMPQFSIFCVSILIKVDDEPTMIITHHLSKALSASNEYSSSQHITFIFLNWNWIPSWDGPIQNLCCKRRTSATQLLQLRSIFQTLLNPSSKSIVLLLSKNHSHDYPTPSPNHSSSQQQN